MRIIFLAAATAIAACNNNPTKNSAKATVSESVAVSPQAPAGATTFTFSNDGSTVAFVGAKVTGKHEGGFKTFKGTVSLVDNDIDKASVSVEIEATSLFTDQEKLTKHLKSGDFFDVEKFPKASFVSTQLKRGVNRGAPCTVTGNLTLHGVTKSISFPAWIKQTDAGVEANAEFGINRKDFGIAYAGKADDLIKDDVLIKLSLRAKK